jgi:hypothetical protein
MSKAVVCLTTRFVSGVDVKRLLALVIAGGWLAAAGPIQASGLPRVYIGYPNPAPCVRSIKMHGKYVNHRVACYEARPPTISVSEDGNGFLSDITWSVWSDSTARGSGLQSVRCFGILQGHAQNPNCAPYHCSSSGGPTYCYPRLFSYNVPATIRLSVPVATAGGVDFTRLRVSSSPTDSACLPPANSC